MEWIGFGSGTATSYEYEATCGLVEDQQLPSTLHIRLLLFSSSRCVGTRAPCR